MRKNNFVRNLKIETLCVTRSSTGPQRSIGDTYLDHVSYHLGDKSFHWVEKSSQSFCLMQK